MTIGSRFSRRGLLRIGLVGVLVAAAPVTPSEAQRKTPKKLVKYQETPKGKQTCDQCLHFQAPASCKLVAGTINPKGWCQLFAPKPK